MADPFECAAWDDDEGVEKLNAELFHLQALPSQHGCALVPKKRKGKQRESIQKEGSCRGKMKRSSEERHPGEKNVDGELGRRKKQKNKKHEEECKKTEDTEGKKKMKRKSIESNEVSPVKRKKGPGNKETVFLNDENDSCLKKEGADGGEQLKRKRKRKNNPKKNKYAHLAINRKVSQTDEEEQREAQTVEISRESKAKLRKKKRLQKGDQMKSESGEPDEGGGGEIDGISNAEGKKKKSKVKKKRKLLKNGSLNSDNLNSEAKDTEPKSTKQRGVKQRDPDSDEDTTDDQGLEDVHDEEEEEESFEMPKLPFNQDELKKRLCGKVDEETKVKESKPQTLRERMEARLNSGRFRFLNEQLYTIPGDQAFEMFADDPNAFDVYHKGYQSQVSKWPQNPVDLMINYIKKQPKKSVVADFGCGDAKIARSVVNRVHSFDLVSLNEHVTACDMSKVPLDSGTVDIGVFCLSLMGTNVEDYLAEANRVVKNGGKLLVAEVCSRFEKIGVFVKKMGKMGFGLSSVNDDNKMFVWFEFTKKKASPKPGLRPSIELMPCLYKKR